MDAFERFWDQIVYSVPNLLIALIMLIVAVALGMLVKTLIINGGKKLNLDRKLTTESTSGNRMLNTLGSLGFIIIILLFLPGILARLGLDSISLPITGMLTGLVAYLPKLIGAVLILVVGIFLAKLIRELVLVALKKLNVDSYQKRFGIRKNDSTVTFSTLGSTIVYYLVLIPIIIAALNALNISAISAPAVSILNNIFGMIPQIIGALIVIALGVIIAKFVTELIYSLVSGSGLSEKLGEALEDESAYRIDFAKIISEAVRVLIIALSVIQALNILNLDILRNIGVAIVAFLPRLIAALAILLVAYIAGALVKKFIRNTFPNSRFAAMATNFAIMFIAALAALSQLGIAREFILPLFLGAVIAATVATGLAFGLGGKEFAARNLDRLDKSIEENKASLKEATDKLAEADRQNEAASKVNIEKAKSEFRDRIRKFKEDKERKDEEFRKMTEEEKLRMVERFNRRTMNESHVPQPNMNMHNNQQYRPEQYRPESKMQNNPQMNQMHNMPETREVNVPQSNEHPMDQNNNR